MQAPFPADESARIVALHSYQILDTSPEIAFDRIADLASQVLDVPISAVSFVDRDRQWFKAMVGLPICETTREISFCAHAILEDDIFEVPDATADPRFADNPLVTEEPGVRFYAGAALRMPDGQPLGALCVLDTRPRKLDKRQRKILRDLAALAVDELLLRSQHQALQDLHDSVEKQIEERTTQLHLVNQELHAEILQRKLANEEQRRSKQRFRQLFNQASDAAFVHDVDGRILDVNDAACASLGYSREELLTLGVPDIEMTHVPAEGFQFWRELPVGSTEKFEGCHRRKDGSTLPVEIHVSVLETSEGRRLLALIRDISERKQIEKRLQATARNQAAIVQLGNDALGGEEEDALIQKAVVLVGQTLGVEICRVLEHLPEQSVFAVRASVSPFGQDIGMVYSADNLNSLGGRILHTAQPVIILDVTAEKNLEIPKIWRTNGAKSAFGVLIGGPNAGNLHYGFFALAALHPRVFTAEEISFVQSVANILASAIVRRRDEGKLRAVETRYQRIAAHTPGVVYQYERKSDGTLAVPFISESCRGFYGREPHEIQENPEIMTERVHPEDRPSFAKAIDTAEKMLTPLHWQGRHLLPSGEVRWVRFDSRPERLPDGSVICDGIIIDVTAEQQSKVALQQSEERFRKAIMHSPLPIMLHASDGEIIQVNHAWTHMTGYRAEELATMEDWLERAYPDEAVKIQIRQFLGSLLSHVGAVSSPSRHVRCLGGEVRIWDFSSALLDRLPDGRWLHITTATDVTEQHAVDAELRAAKEEAERANNAKSQFLSRMSHELRTPLNAILGFGQLLEFSAQTKQDALSVMHILKGGYHLLSLIDEVLDLSRAETGALHLALDHVDVNEITQECVDLVTGLAKERGITCKVKLSRRRHISLLVDAQRLRQILLNLLSNAIKYNHQDGEVLITSEKMSAGRLRLKVNDTGPGISPEGIKRLFVPFERLEHANGAIEGTGLGLVVSRQMAEAMGGNLGVESVVGEGSTFWVELPMAEAPTASQPEEKTADPMESMSGVPLHVKLLYIEDNISNLQVVEVLFSNFRPYWTFIPARDGILGLESARRELPDVILLDLQLPGMSGDEVLKELRRDPLTRHIPVILLSADATAHSREQLLASGANDYIAKPFKVQSLLELLEQTLLKAKKHTVPELPAEALLPAGSAMLTTMAMPSHNGAAPSSPPLSM